MSEEKSAEELVLPEGESKDVPQVYAAVNELRYYLSQIGIGKNNKNQQQNYNYRGIDDVYNNVTVGLSKFGLCYHNSVESSDSERVATGNGKFVTVARLLINHVLTSVKDGSQIVSTSSVSANDYADKAELKALSQSVKYFFISTFTIPVNGQEEIDNDSQNIEVNQPQGQATRVAAAPAKDPYDPSMLPSVIVDAITVVNEGGDPPDGEVFNSMQQTLKAYGADMWKDLCNTHKRVASQLKANAWEGIQRSAKSKGYEWNATLGSFTKTTEADQIPGLAKE